MVVVASLIACHNHNYLRTSLIIGAYYLIEIGLSFFINQFWSADNMVYVFGLYICIHLSVISILLTHGSKGRIFQSIILSLFILLFILSPIDYFFDYGILKFDPIVENYSLLWRVLMVSHIISLIIASYYSLIIGSYYVGMADLVHYWNSCVVGSKKNTSVRDQRKRR